MWAIASAAFLMGLLGGAHCLVMCAAPCNALLQSSSQGGDQLQVVKFVRNRRSWGRPLLFHLGRILGYSLVGAMAAYAMDRLAWFSQGTSALRPVWSIVHVAIIGWGLMMLMRLNAPAWMESAGRTLWQRVQPVVARPGGIFAVGCGWAFMPCGLLYSALLLAALSGGPAAGALSMALFAVASGVWLVAGRWLWISLRERIRDPRWEAWGSRIAGLILMALGATALWWGVVHQQPSPWCLP
ncbi:sulfite exporter TauE/SafE family protein [Diaphorobacter caeni]|uniref:sulfite exporter TauE/SafE family protein n=1 Tax=Diaphorobacter caeni TaxID=2784387 RepID=UPI00188F797C|nr:sulfite exporter TauE/SafE family protein [Diaphorobacter caeni]MBF5006509.1 sulfite exporter TauE/SafE family protein [Diaphorobacter caeni]